MNYFQLVFGALCYALTVYSLCLVSWAVVRWTLPRGSRVGLRLAAVFAGQFVGCAIVVQSLGLIGQLRTVAYMMVTLGAGAAVSWAARKHRPHRSLWRLFRDTLHLWLDNTPLGLGYLGAVSLLALAYRFFAYVQGIDSLSIHGPLVVRWIQSGRIELATRWNYPLCWEYQYVPNFMLLRSDVLVVVPSLLQIVVLLLLVREAASRLGIPGKIAALVSLLCVLNPVVWGGTMKNDPVVAVGLLLSFLALERVAGGRRGGIWLAQLGAFILLGSKATGFVYAGLVLGPTVVIWVIRCWQSDGWIRFARGSRLAWQVAGTVLLQISAASVQTYNFLKHGSPTYPNKFGIGEWVIFDGPRNLSGTSILEAGGQIKTWTLLLRGSTEQLGLDFPVLVVLLLAGTCFGIGRLVYTLARGRGADRYLLTFGVAAVATCVLWVLYLATPWSRGTLTDVTRYIRHGESLRYAIGAICLTYLVATGFLVRVLGRQRVFRLLSLTFLVLALAKWVLKTGIPKNGFWHSPMFSGVWKLVVLWALLWAAVALAAALWRKSGELPKAARDGFRTMAVGGLAVLVFMFHARWLEKERFWNWDQPRRKLWHQVRKQVPDGAIVGTDTSHPLYAYLLFGARLENQVNHVPFGKVRRGEPVDVDFYYLSVDRPPAKRKKALRALRRRGWRRVVETPDKRGLLLRHPRMLAPSASE